MTEEIKFNDKQVEILTELNKLFKGGKEASIFTAFMMNVFDVLYLGRDLGRIQQMSRYKDEFGVPRQSASECLIRDSKVPAVHEYVQTNENRILDI